MRAEAFDPLLRDIVDGLGGDYLIITPSVSGAECASTSWTLPGGRWSLFPMESGWRDGTLLWDGRKALGRRIPAGVYHARLIADGVERTQGVLIVR